MRSIITVCCLLIVVSGSTVVAQIVTDGLVSYYTMDKNTIQGNKLNDVVGNTNGNILGSTKSVPGHLGEALEFAGAPDCINLPPIYEIGKNPVTYETWIKLTDNTG